VVRQGQKNNPTPVARGGVLFSWYARLAGYDDCFGSSLSYRFWFGLRLGSLEAIGLVLYRMCLSVATLDYFEKPPSNEVFEKGHRFGSFFRKKIVSGFFIVNTKWF